MAKLTKTKTPGVFRRHVKGCDGRGRCECSYVVVWRHQGKQSMETFPSFELAREAKAKRHVVDSRPATKITFGDYFAEWIETYAGRTRRGFSESTRIEYRRSIEVHVLSRWGTWKLTDIDRSAVSKLYKAVRKEDSSPSQVPKLRAALSALFATALEEEEVPFNPVAGIRVPAPVADEPGDDRAKALTREELGLLLAAVPEDWRLFFEFLAVTGLRISEAVGLTWEHLDLGDGPRVLVREQLYEGKRKRLKSNAGRRDVPLSPAFATRLLSHRRDAYGGPSAPVFASTAGTPLRPSNVHRRVLAPARDAVGLSWATFHSLRHTCASLLFEDGRNVKQVAEWLGHADAGFTLRTYVHLLDAGVGGGLDLLAQVNTGSTRRTEIAAIRDLADRQDLAA